MFDASTWRARFRFHDDAQQPTDATNISPLSKKQIQHAKPSRKIILTPVAQTQAKEEVKQEKEKEKENKARKKCQKEKGKYEGNSRGMGRMQKVRRMEKKKGKLALVTCEKKVYGIKR